MELAGSPPTIEIAVELIASRLLDGISCPPTDLDALKRRVNVTAFEAVPGFPISGELRRRGDGFVVAYADSLSPGRRRFTIAHELGHAVFEMTGPNCPRFGQELERLCDMLAAEFLLPRAAFLEHVGSDFGPATVYDLARQFDASLMAVAVRCHTLRRTSVFQIENGRLAWGFGAIRREQDLRADSEAFAHAISHAMRGTSGEAAVFVRNIHHKLSWANCGLHRALFTMMPTVRPRALVQRNRTMMEHVAGSETAMRDSG